MTVKERKEIEDKILKEEAEKVYPDNTALQEAFIKGFSFSHDKFFKNKVNKVLEEKRIESLRQKYSEYTEEELRNKIYELTREMETTYKDTVWMYNRDEVEEIRNAIRNKWYKI